MNIYDRPTLKKTSDRFSCTKRSNYHLVHILVHTPKHQKGQRETESLYTERLDELATWHHKVKELIRKANNKE